MVTVDSWTAWMERAAKLLGMHGARDLDTLAEWTHLFARRSFGIGDMTDALEAVALEPPIHKREVLGKLIGLVRAKLGSRAPPAEDRGTCTLCGNSGLVTVPHPQHTEAQWYTLGVTCRCPSGQRVRRQHTEYAEQKGWPADRRSLSLDDYEATYGRDWTDVLAAHEQALRARNSGTVNLEAKNAQGAFDAIVERLRDEQAVAPETQRPNYQYPVQHDDGFTPL